MINIMLLTFDKKKYAYTMLRIYCKSFSNDLCITRSVVLLITVHLVYTVLVFIGGPWGEARAPPPQKKIFFLLASLWGGRGGGTCPPKFLPDT